MPFEGSSIYRIGTLSKDETSPIHTAFRGGHICPVLSTKSELKEPFVVRSYLGAHCRPLWEEMLKCEKFNDAH